MGSLPSCLVLMAAYNPSDYIVDQISSILNQQNVLINLSVSDDSLDKSLLIRRLSDASCGIGGKLISKIKLYEGPRKNLASANFFHLILNSSASADFYAFSDQDDLWLESKIFNAINLLQANNCDCYSSELNVWDDCSLVHNSMLTGRWKYKQKHFGMFFAESAGCTYVFSKRAFIALRKRILRLSREKLLWSVFSHDLFASVFLQSQGYKWFHDHESSVYYRQHSANVWGASVLSRTGLTQRFRLMAGKSYYLALYLAWMDSPRGSLPYRLWISLGRLRLFDRFFLVSCALRSVKISNPKGIGLLAFFLFTQRSPVVGA